MILYLENRKTIGCYIKFAREGVVLVILLIASACSSSVELPSGSSDVTKEIHSKAQSFYYNEKGFLEAAMQDENFLIQIPAGEFPMGSDQGEEKELPVHGVHLDEYWMSKYPVTVNQFAIFVEETGYVTDAENGEGSWIEEGGGIRYDVNWSNPNFNQGGDHPVICVSWNDAIAYCDWLSNKIGLPVQLPTEAQWEKAARGEDQRLWPWGNDLPDGTQANFADINYIKEFGEDKRNATPEVDDGFSQTSPVDAFPKGQSPYGVYDMAGNVIDWLYDWFDHSYYAISPERNPFGLYETHIRRKEEIPGGWGDNLQRSIRGGAWTDASGELSLEEGGHSVRSDMRESTDQYSSDDHLGFRFVVDPRHRYHSFHAKPDSHIQASVMESIGSSELTILYDRIEAKDTVFGKELPFGEIWSPGEEFVSVFSVSKPIQIQGETLPAGSYNFYIVPEEISPDYTPGASLDWTIVFTQPANRRQSAFKSEEEVLSVKARAQLEDNSKKRMEYFFDLTDEDNMIIRFLYEYVEVHIPIETSDYKIDEISKARVANTMNNTTVQIAYHRDLAAGRNLFGSSIPFKQPWMAGTLKPTTIEFSHDVHFNKIEVQKGLYYLSLILQKGDEWIVTLSVKDKGITKKVVESPIQVDVSESGPDRLEYFFGFNDVSSRTLVLAWDKVTISFDVTSSINKEIK